jgi:hypothetical protein
MWCVELALSSASYSCVLDSPLPCFTPGFVCYPLVSRSLSASVSFAPS